MAESHNLRNWRRRAAALGAACLLATAVAARRAGLPDPLCGTFLAVSVAGMLSWLAAATVRRARLTAREAFAWAVGLAVAAAGPVFTAAWPGEEVATGLVAAPGDTLRLVETCPGSHLLLVSAAVPEPGQVSFDLRVGGELVSGELYRGARRWSVGDERGHVHLNRASLVERVDLPAGEFQVTLERTSEPGLALTMSVYRERLPGWLPALAALCALLAFAWRVAPLGGGREAIMAASAAVLGGLAIGAAVTPAQAMGAAIRGLFLGGLGGLPLGAALASAAAGARRLVGGARRR
jgi:hypothetical protein